MVAGQALVSGDDGAQRTVCAGEGAYWRAGEAHETSSKDGMMAFVLEGPGVDPANFLPGSEQF